MKNSKKYLLSLELRDAMEKNLNLSSALCDKGEKTNNINYYKIINIYLSYDLHLDYKILSRIAYNCYSKEYKTTTYKDIHYYITYINGCIEATKGALKTYNLEY